MFLETFQENFQMRDINIKPYLIVVSIFISIILIITLLNNKLKDYYICNGRVLDSKVVTIVNSDDLNKITENNKIKIERNIFTYKVSKIEEVIYNESFYYEITLEFDRIPQNIFVDNNIIKIEVIVNETTIFDYLIKTARGE